jgi:hypothetical protein
MAFAYATIDDVIPVSARVAGYIRSKKVPPTAQACYDASVVLTYALAQTVGDPSDRLVGGAEAKPVSPMPHEREPSDNDAASALEMLAGLKPAKAPRVAADAPVDGEARTKAKPKAEGETTELPTYDDPNDVNGRVPWGKVLKILIKLLPALL